MASSQEQQRFLSVPSGGAGRCGTSSSTNSRSRSPAPSPRHKRAHRMKKDGGTSTPDKDVSDKDGANGLEQLHRPIFNEEIAQLKITESDLASLKAQAADEGQQQQQQQQQQRTVPVRKEIPLDQQPKNVRIIGLLKRQPPGRTMAASGSPTAPTLLMTSAPRADVSGASGPRFNPQGRLIGHSILGNPLDYYRLAVAKGHLQMDQVPAELRLDNYAEQLPTKERTHPTTQSPFSYGAADMAALNQWQLRMLERKRLQGRISKLLDRPIADLAMNSADNRRGDVEDKDLIGRAIPFYDSGMGYRGGSEFWQLPDRIGHPSTAIHSTLTLTQQGYPPPLERVGLSALACAEQLGGSRDSPRYPWKRYPQQRQESESSYLHDRRIELAKAISELEPHRPDLSQLAVIGRADLRDVQGGGPGNIRDGPGGGPGNIRDGQGGGPGNIRDGQGGGHGNIRDAGLGQGGGQMDLRVGSRSTTAVVPSVDRPEAAKSTGLTHRVSGPSMLFGGQPARWLGDPRRYRGTAGIEARVILDSTVDQPTSQCLEFENDGTTVLFYRWKRQEQPNPFGMDKPPVRRFYFDIAGGVLLPGERLHFPFIFKSNQPGVFTERWQLETTPSLLAGADLIVTLRGLAVQADVNLAARAELEATLTRRCSVRMVGDILSELLNGLPLTGHCRQSIDEDSSNEMETFRRANADLAVCQLDRRWWMPDADLVTRFRRLYAGAKGADEWDLSVTGLRRKLLSSERIIASAASTASSRLASSSSSSGAAQAAAGRLYALVDTRMSFRIDLGGCNRRQRCHVLCYGLVLQTMDKIFNCWHYQRFISGLPDIDADFPDPSSRRSRMPGNRRQKQSASATSKSTGGSSSAKSTSAMQLRPKSVAKGDKKLLKQQQKLQLQQSLNGFNGHIVEQKCTDKIYSATYCLLVALVEEVADLCDQSSDWEYCWI